MTKVAAPIDPQGSFPAVLSSDVEGGIQIVSAIAAFDTEVPAHVRKEGMRVIDLSTDRVWRIEADLVTLSPTTSERLLDDLAPAESPRRTTRDFSYVRVSKNTLGEIVYAITQDRQLVGPVGVPEEWKIGTHALRAERDVRYARLVKDDAGAVLYGVKSDGAFQVASKLEVGEATSMTPVRDAKYSRIIKNTLGEILFAVRHDGTAEFGDISSVTDTKTGSPAAPTWVDDWPRLVPVYTSGQSLSNGAKSVKPDEIFRAQVEPAAPGRSFQFGDDSPRVTGAGTSDLLDFIAARDRFNAIYDHHEFDSGNTAATSAWTFVKSLVDADTLPNSAYFVINTGIGGNNIETVNSGAPLVNRRRAFQAAGVAAQDRNAIFADFALFLLDHQNADRGDESSVYQAKVLATIAGVESDLLRAGGNPDGVYSVVTSGQSCYNAGAPSSDVPLTGLILALANERIAVWGPEYVLEVAVGALADGGDDPIHRAAIGQARAGLYQFLAISSMLNGSKRQPLHCAGNATLAGDGLSATMTYTNPRAGSLAVDTSTVTDPAVAGYDDADLRRPRGFMLANADGTTPHASGILATDVSVSGNDVTVTFASDITTAVDGTDGNGGAMINVANYYEGQSAGAINPGGIVSGTDRGARACVRNDGSADTMTITDPLTLTGTDIIPHDWVMPQRIPLVI